MDLSKEWDKRYDCEHFVYGTEANEFLVQSSGQLKPQSKILCLADGEGRNSVYLSKLGHQVTAIDFSHVAQKKALILAQKNDIELNYIVCDMKEYPFEKNQWDAIVSIFAHTSSTTRHYIWDLIKFSLKKNGLFILEAYHPKQLELNYNSGGPKKTDWLVSLKDILSSFKAFNQYHQWEGERVVNEGTLHHGKAFVTQYVGQKIE